MRVPHRVDGPYRLKPLKLVFAGFLKSGWLYGANNLPGATLQHGSETLSKSNVKFMTLVDAGHHQKDRELWAKRLCGAIGVIFMVDARDPERFDEAAAELHALSTAEGLEGVPFLMVSGIKIDHLGAVTSAEVIWDRLWVHEIKNEQSRYSCTPGPDPKRVLYGLETT
ncbi:hypothetical protein B0H66DRAFT_23333 [Apodospora peruviana]|uniref:Uncharacterized protein n=1 Tax=Apodospora peruviana TaxID=516989 RepID=A0AAE0MFS5_9PEZI|nr:hypothetical protein B0H66DRAFT_23333 [Apodospora peruviana]